MNYLNKFILKSKVSIVTGGAGGIGEEICKALLDAGSNCLLYTSPSPRDAHESRMPSSA